MQIREQTRSAPVDFVGLPYPARWALVGRYWRLLVVPLKNEKPIARTVPDREKVCYGRDLARLLENLELPPREARAWRRDLRAGRKILKAPVDKWR